MASVILSILLALRNIRVIMKNSNQYTTMVNNKYKLKVWDILKIIVKPIFEQFPYIFLFLNMMGFWTVYNLAVDRLTATEMLSTIPSWSNLYARAVVLILFAYIGAVLMTVIRNKPLKRFVKILIYVLVLALFLIRYFIRRNFDLDINPTCFVLLAETTGAETADFINQYVFSTGALSTLLMLVVYTVAIFTLEHLWSKKKDWLKKMPSCAKKIVYAILFFLLLSGVYSTKIYWTIYNIQIPDNIRLLNPPADPISSVYTSLVSLHIMKDNVQDAIEINKNVYASENAYTIQDDSVNIVVVIGESYIKWHSQLYGYNLNTTPNMSAEERDGRLFVFNDVISSSNSTSIVMRDLFCCNNSSAREQWYDYPSFLTIFKKAGWNVYFWDNQRSYAKLATFSFTLNSFLYNPELEQILYSKTNSTTFKYDADIVDAFNESLDVAGRKNLILFHLLGQHVAPSGRFPHDTFKHFTADSIDRKDAFLTEEMKEYIADYDNATLYNDYVMSKMFDKFKDSNTILLYFSDHGEEAYDFRKHCGRDHGKLSSMVLKYQYDIPFVIWCSETYKKNNPEIVERIRQAVNRPFVLDNVCNMLFNIGGIKTSYYRENLDLISPNYECKERIIKGEYVYEKIRYAD